MTEKDKCKDEKICYEDAHKSTTNGNEMLSVCETQTKIQLSKSSSSNEAEAKSLNSKCTKVECERPSETKPKVQRMPLLKLWLVLILTLIFALVSLTASHLTHSLTLRVEAYHSLYNLMALTGCLITIKVCERPASINNTFGWARIELLSCLCSLLFMASFCFSIALESVQTAAKAGLQFNANTTDPKQYYKIVIAIPFLDDLTCQLESKFISHKTILKNLSKLIPSEAVKNFMDIKNEYNQYCHLISDQETINAEFILWRKKWENHDIKDLPSNVIDALNN
ncbi:Zinc/cadmium resistance protein [Armadillidium nasatum]|uniref:Zinc/cadmium resistance protein n=1 Tax=Armadillidium nasatum TaxID=96803 RepID=A0A5N5TD27_9CRUS|nr:Zinc/cadmium resistance protein [Armadillidium nasatum]